MTLNLIELRDTLLCLKKMECILPGKRLKNIKVHLKFHLLMLNPEKGLCPDALHLYSLNLILIQI